MIYGIAPHSHLPFIGWLTEDAWRKYVEREKDDMGQKFFSEIPPMELKAFTQKLSSSNILMADYSISCSLQQRRSPLLWVSVPTSTILPVFSLSDSAFLDGFIKWLRKQRGGDWGGEQIKWFTLMSPLQQCAAYKQIELTDDTVEALVSPANHLSTAVWTPGNVERRYGRLFSPPLSLSPSVCPSSLSLIFSETQTHTF